MFPLSTVGLYVPSPEIWMSLRLLQSISSMEVMLSNIKVMWLLPCLLGADPWVPGPSYLITQRPLMLERPKIGALVTSPTELSLPAKPPS